MTKDEHFELIIVDYQSADLDIEAELRASSLPRSHTHTHSPSLPPFLTCDIALSLSLSGGR